MYCLKTNKMKINGNIWIDKLLKSNLSYTKPGSISFLLYGKQPSEQSINIKFGRFGEFLTKELIKSNDKYELLKCGIQNINGRKKDVDLLFRNTNIIYYRELKGNIDLDTEKLPATIDKCKEIETSLKKTYPDCSINCAILNWSIYNRNILSSIGLRKIKIFESKGLKIEHMNEFFNIIDTVWDEDDFYLYFRDIGNKLKK